MNVLGVIVEQIDWTGKSKSYNIWFEFSPLGVTNINGRLLAAVFVWCSL
jgi:hypothetical protein